MRLYDVIGRFRFIEECEVIVLNDNCDCVDCFNATNKKMRSKYKDHEIGMMEIVDGESRPYVRIEVYV